MTDSLRTIPLGSATVSVINVGDIILSLSQALSVPESEWRPHYAAEFEQALPFPSNCVHLAVPGASILVDANNYEVAFPPTSPFLPPNYQPPPDMITQLREKGISAESITHLVITHAHRDHYVGVTMLQDGQYVPCFPNARCFLNRADWENPDMQEALQDADSVESHTLGVLHRLGLLNLVEGNHHLNSAVSILAAPGESVGHQIVRVHVDGQTFYSLGDLFHHEVEVEHPEWMASWANAESNLASRHALIKAALEENALLVAAHIADIGRLKQTAKGTRWVAV